jgi:hypothetical protein
MCRSARGTCSTRCSSKPAGLLARGAEKVPTRCLSKRASKQRACGFRRQNVNPLLVLRNALCNRQGNPTWAATLTQRQGLRTSQRQVDSQQRLASAFCMLVFWGVHVSGGSHPPVHVATEPPAQARAENPTRRPGSGYSWRNPFLRRPPSNLEVSGEAGAKKCTAPAL